MKGGNALKIFINFTVKIIFILFCISSQLSLANVTEEAKISNKNQLVWLVEDKKENINLLDKKDADTSVASYIESNVISELKQYDINIKRVSVKRIDQTLKANLMFVLQIELSLNLVKNIPCFLLPKLFI